MRDLYLNEIYRQLDVDLAALHNRINGDNREVNAPFAATPDLLAELDREYSSLKARVQQLDAPDGVYHLMKHIFEDFLDSIGFALEGFRRNPEAALGNLAEIIMGIGRNDKRSDEERSASVIRLLTRVRDLSDFYLEAIRYAYGRTNCGGAAENLRRAADNLETEMERLRDHFPDMEEQLVMEMQEAGEGCVHVLRVMAVFLAVEAGEAPVVESKKEDDLSIRVKMDPIIYRDTLMARMGVSLDEILAWHKEEMDKTRSDCYRIARALDIPEADVQSMKEVCDIIFKYEPPCDSAQEMFDRCNAYLKRTRALAHEYVNLPAHEECVCVPIPAFYKDSYPWGGYEGGDFRKAPFEGHMFLNQYNFNNITDSWIKLNSLHEAYPGHHVQYVRAAIDETPRTVKIGAKLIPLLEGTCLRTETAFQDVFAEDPVFPLFIAYRRHHASTRIFVDLMMFYFGATLEEVVQIYETELGFDRVTARAQVQAHQNAPGYFICYYYGMKKLLQWEQEYGYDKKTFTELLFSAGYISIEAFHELAALNPQDQQRYFHDFYSKEENDG